MRERICQHQETSLETSLNIHPSRCRNRASEHYLGPIHKGRCQDCEHRTTVIINAKAEAEMAKYIFPETLSKGRPPELIDELFETHCKKCKSYNPRDGLCVLNTNNNQRWFMVRDLMENETLHCEKGAW